MLGALALALAGLGCGEFPGGASDHEDEPENNTEMSELPPVDSVGVRPNSIKLPVGGSTRLSLYVRDATGQALEPGSYETLWTTDNKDVVRVDADGQVHAVSTGVTRVNAFVRGVKGWATIRVTREVERIEIVAPDRALIPGESVKLEAHVWSKGGVRMDGATVIWSTVATDTARMREGGRIRALRPGYVTVTAMADGVAGRKTLSIGDYEIRGIRIEGLPERLSARDSVEVAPVALGHGDYPLEHVDVHLSSGSEHLDVVPDDVVSGKSAGWGQLVAEASGYAEQRDLLVYEPFVELDAGRTHSCAIDAVGRAFCWGANTYGEVGGDVQDSLGRPVLVSEMLRFDDISAGSFHSCGVTVDDELYCWGSNRNGKLGDGTDVDRWHPVRVAGDIAWEAVTTGVAHTCGLSTRGLAYCWGSNEAGERLGTGRIGDAWEPQLVAGGRGFTQVSAGLDHTCALEVETQQAWCWGNNDRLQLGLDATRTQTDDGQQLSRVPLLVSSDKRFKEVHAALAHSFSCGRTVEDEVLCWGNNRRGALLEGGSDYPMSEERDPLESSFPLPIHDDGRAYQALDLGAHACGVRDGDIYCWTDGFHTVQAHPYLPPPKQFGAEQLASLSSFEHVAAGQKFTCGISEKGELYCAGPDFRRFAESQGFTPSASRLYRLLLPDLAEYQR
ncbi:MAG: Ig-like domain-containing protein [Myxococcota bacterium]